MRNYELMVLLHPDLEIDVDAPLTKIETLVKSAGGGKVLKRDNWGKRRLSYPVKKQQFAVYVYFELALDPLKARAFENSLLITEEIIRHLLVKSVEEEQNITKKLAKAAKVKAAAEKESE